MTTALPIDDLRPPIERALAGGDRRWILTAPTGSGKSTQVPQMIADAPDFPRDLEVLILQPRRMAARLLARWVAGVRQSRLGGEVGYQVRFESHVSADTRIRYVTEGILLRQLLDDPELKGVGCVILDEFHERHIFTDLTLGRLKALQETHRPDLLLAVMSATLETDPLEAYLPGSTTMRSEGRVHPVDIEHGRRNECDPQRPVWDRAADALQRLLPDIPEGDALVFMPGAFEIRRTIRKLLQMPQLRGWEIVPLYGDLNPDEQDRAVSGRGRARKIVVSTNIAETSITIEGVRLVVDSGLARMAGYDARRGINTLLVEPISRQSADQRAGRAGRTAPGRCLRLWSEKEHQFRPTATVPEIKRLDLAETLLFLKASGFTNVEDFPWYDPPHVGQLDRARLLLDDLGALEDDGALSRVGEQMAAFPVHPRYARMFLYGSEAGCLPDLALAAALSQDRSILLNLSRDRIKREKRDRQFLNENTSRSDFLYQMEAWHWARQKRFEAGACEEMGIHGQTCRRAERVAAQFISQARAAGLDTRDREVESEVLCRGLLLGFADHLARRVDRGTRRCLLVHGRSGELRKESVIEERGLLVAADLEEVSKGSQVQLLLGMATVVEPDWLKAYFPNRFHEEHITDWDASGKRIVQRRQTRFQDLILEEQEMVELDDDLAAPMWADGVLEGRLTIKAWGSEVEKWIQRVNFLATQQPESGLALIDEAARKMLLETLCHGCRSSRDIRDLDPWPVLKSWIPQGFENWVDWMAPEALELPVRKRPFKLRYDRPDEPPVMAATIQELYDVDSSQLTVLRGELPVKLELLAPNRNPVQILSASDLDAFWTQSYPAIRKDLRGRYPKHEWR